MIIRKERMEMERGVQCLCERKEGEKDEPIKGQRKRERRKQSMLFADSLSGKKVNWRKTKIQR